MFHWFGRKKTFPEDGNFTLSSPNGRIVCHIYLKQGLVSYSVEKDHKSIIRESKLGLTLRGEAPIGHDFGLVRTHHKKFDETWEAPWGEQRFIRNNYQEFTLYLAENTERARLFTIRFRAFNDGVAFRYEIPAQPAYRKNTISAEFTEFNVDPNALAWQIPAYQPDRYEYNYTRTPIFELRNAIHTPLTIELPTGYFISIHEAALYNYGAMTIYRNKNQILTSDITPLSDGMKAYVELPFNVPWRVIMIGDSAGDLITNRIIYNLNDPPHQDFSWVKPIKFLGIWWAMFTGEWTWAPGARHGATTEHAKTYIDACQKLGLDGLLMEGWNNGWEGDWLKNGDTTDFLHPMPDLDLDAVADYAKDHHISLVGHHETVGFIDNYESQLEKAYQYYSDLGIKYIKPGYAGSMMTINGRREYHHSQLGVKHYQKALELAAKYHICLDVHEPIKGTGIERTYPNLLTREGARGQEYEGGALSPSHTTILPFTRLLAGGMDYTPGIFDVTNGTKRIATTITRQLAYYVTIYSGTQMAADRPRFYLEKYPDLFQFIHDVPVKFSETRPLLCEIGVLYVVARKDWEGKNWYLGGLTNEEGRRVHLDFDFLDDNQVYEATIYHDGADAHYRDNQLSYQIEKRMIQKTDALDIDIAPGGGFAISLKTI